DVEVVLVHQDRRGAGPATARPRQLCSETDGRHRRTDRAGVRGHGVVASGQLFSREEASLWTIVSPRSRLDEFLPPCAKSALAAHPPALGSRSGPKESGKSRSTVESTATPAVVTQRTSKE